MFNIDLLGNIEPLSIYLARPSGKPLGCIDSEIEADSASITLNLNDMYDLSFDMKRNPTLPVSWYESVQEGMYLIVEKVGLFKINSPTNTLTGDSDSKSISATSCNVELDDKNTYIEINMGTKTSQEYLLSDGVHDNGEVHYTYGGEDYFELIVDPYRGIPIDWIVLYNTFADQLEILSDGYLELNYGVLSSVQNGNEIDYTAVITNPDEIAAFKAYIDLIPRLQTEFIKNENGEYEPKYYVQYTYDDDGEVTQIDVTTGFIDRISRLIEFYNTYADQLSLLNLVLESSGGDWKVGTIYGVDNNDFTLANRKAQFEISGDGIYAFLTTTLAQYLECLVGYDIFTRTVNITPVEYIGEDTGIVMSYDNLVNSLGVSPSDDEQLTTRLKVTGADDLDITRVNFGQEYIEDLSYKMNAKDSNGNRIYVSDSLATKYAGYVTYRESQRDDFIEYSKQYDRLQQEIDEIKYRVPNDELKNDWSTFSMEDLEIYRTAYINSLNTLITLYKEDYGTVSGALYQDGSINEWYMKHTEYWYDYSAYKSLIHEVECAMSTFPYYSDQDKWTETNKNYYKEKIKAWETDWRLYGTVELKNKVETYKTEMNLLAESSVVRIKPKEMDDVDWENASNKSQYFYGAIERGFNSMWGDLSLDEKESYQTVWDNLSTEEKAKYNDSIIDYYVDKIGEAFYYFGVKYWNEATIEEVIEYTVSLKKSKIRTTDAEFLDKYGMTVHSSTSTPYFHYNVRKYSYNGETFFAVMEEAEKQDISLSAFDGGVDRLRIYQGTYQGTYLVGYVVSTNHGNLGSYYQILTVDEGGTNFKGRLVPISGAIVPYISLTSFDDDNGSFQSPLYETAQTDDGSTVYVDNDTSETNLLLSYAISSIDLTTTDKTRFGNLDEKYYYTTYLEYYQNYCSAKAKMEALESEVSALQNQLETVQTNRTNITQSVKIENYSNGGNSFTPAELRTIYRLYRDSDYSNDNFLVTNITTTDERIDILKELMDDGIEKLSSFSRPQLKFDVDLDNVLGLPDYKPFWSKFKNGNYMYVQYKDDVYIKLRMTSYTFNPMLPTAKDFKVTFSNFIRSNVSITDIESILGASSGSSGRSSSGSSGGGSGGAFGEIEKLDITISNTMLSKLLKSESFGTRVSNIILDTIHVNAITSQSATFQGLANGSTTIDGGCLQTGLIKSNNYTYNSQNATETGSILNLNDGTFSFGGGSLKYDNHTLSVNGSVIANDGRIGHWDIENSGKYLKGVSIDSDTVAYNCYLTKEHSYPGSWGEYLDKFGFTAHSSDGSPYFYYCVRAVAINGFQDTQFMIMEEAIKQNITANSGAVNFVRVYQGTYNGTHLIGEVVSTNHAGVFDVGELYRIETSDNDGVYKKGQLEHITDSSIISSIRSSMRSFDDDLGSNGDINSPIYKTAKSLDGETVYVNNDTSKTNVLLSYEIDGIVSGYTYLNSQSLTNDVTPIIAVDVKMSSSTPDFSTAKTILYNNGLIKAVEANIPVINSESVVSTNIAANALEASTITASQFISDNKEFTITDSNYYKITLWKYIENVLKTHRLIA